MARKSEQSKWKVVLLGVRPLMFDRYAGDNQTQLNPEEKMYLDDKRRLMFPAINLYSMLCAENTKSVCRQMMGKKGKTIALGVSSCTLIDPADIPILDKPDGTQVAFSGFDKRIYLHSSVARLNKGIPNPKVRPTLALPWTLEFTVEYQDNEHCSIETLRNLFVLGSMIGIGTFRPFFGRYKVASFEMVE
jgi:hypothetical protein